MKIELAQKKLTVKHSKLGNVEVVFNINGYIEYDFRFGKSDKPNNIIKLPNKK